MFRTIVSLVAELHSRGIAHCDIKLDNVLVCGDRLLMSDFSEAVTFSSPEEAQLTESR
jgi:serine/threonine protein kinase